MISRRTRARMTDKGSAPQIIGAVVASKSRVIWSGTFVDRAALVGEVNGGTIMGFGKGMLLWLLGIPLPIIILLARFWHH
jgi:hypothetical protein